MRKKTTISSKALSKCAQAASTQAVKEARASKVAYTVQEGRSIVRYRSDGTKKVIGNLPKAYVKSTARSYRVA